MAFSSGASSALALVLFTCGLFASFPAASGGSVDVGDMLMMDRFLRWQAAHDRSYPSAEEKLRRFEVYRRNAEYIDATNRRGGLTYQLGENQFADLTQEEFLAMYTMPAYDVEDHTDTVITTTAGRVDGGGNANLSCFEDDVAVDAPPSVDWRARGAVVPPKSQSSSCGI